MIRFEHVTEEHKDGVLNLWNNNSGWGPVTWKQVNEWKITPYEDVIHGVAIDENDTVIGQIIFTYCRVVHNGELLKAGRILAPVVNKDVVQNISIRKRSHPILQLYVWVFKEAINQSVDIVYMYPHIKWRPILNIGSLLFGLPKLKSSVYDFYTINCSDYVSIEKNDYEIKVADSFTASHHQLWRACISEYPDHLALERSVEYLIFKAGDEVKLEIWKEGDLVGLMIYHRAKNMIYDLFIRSKVNYKDAIKAALCALGTKFLKDETTVKILGTECIMRYFNEISIEKIDYSHLFAWTSLKPMIDRKANWFLTSLD